MKNGVISTKVERCSVSAKYFVIPVETGILVILDPHCHGDDVGFRENKSIFVGMTDLDNLDRTAFRANGNDELSYWVLALILR
ncbi:hypothetical protein L3V77_01625 [Vibrio sp. DW001]|uniref:hypothetical protein n=1 Tax=Vibrio sp. DW001 TaxID=2912315 RepID=UPI0023AE9F9F|nr:hypothetical protein [Vibrio sp. DW001]WED26979.1 hypothetical protein L3V77_01625 [Vibrio sp. DW001]